MFRYIHPQTKISTELAFTHFCSRFHPRLIIENNIKTDPLCLINFLLSLKV